MSWLSCKDFALGCVLFAYASSAMPAYALHDAAAKNEGHEEPC